MSKLKIYMFNKRKILILFKWNVRKIDCNKYFISFQNKYNYISQLMIFRTLDCHTLFLSR